MHDDLAAFAPFVEKMEAAGLPDVAIRIFQNHYAQLRRGETGFISSAQAGPVDDLPDYTELSEADADAGRAALAKTVVLKLNGGLGTSMGMTGPKSLLPVKEGLTFLDIILRQVEHLRRESGAALPLLLMNSFSTQAETAAVLEKLDWQQELPSMFLQHMMPKIRADTLGPVEWPEDPEKEWCPPGHGDLYAALVSNGLLAAMLAQDYEYLFVSNSDNLGATPDVRILGYMARNEIPFLMEAAQRTTADRKGGHLARQPNGQLILREISQCPPEELAAFQDIERYRFFNTNTLWIHLPSLQALLDAHEGLLALPLIRNEKSVDPTQPGSLRVFQLETAMGAAIESFAGAQAIRAPRTRFVPVKKNSDLLALWSDAYELTEDYRLVLADGIDMPPLVTLDDRFYQLIADLRQRFPHGAPSMRRCPALTVEGDVYFGKNVVLEGVIEIKNPNEQPVHLPDGAHLTENRTENSNRLA